MSTNFKYSVNDIRSSLEAGNSSGFVVTFKSGGPYGPNPRNFNLIKGKFAPVTEYSVNHKNLEYYEITVGPNIGFSLPVRSSGPSEMSMTLVDDYRDTIFNTVRDWIDNLPTNQVPPRVIPLHKLKDYSVVASIMRVDKLGSLIMEPVNYYLLPPSQLDLTNDNSFGLNTIALNFVVIGTE